jgi:chemotaxis protein CheD
MNFFTLNLIEDSWSLREEFDIVFCRNVMIYFDNATQRQVLARIHRLMKPKSTLFVGHAENFSDARSLFMLRGKPFTKKSEAMHRSIQHLQTLKSRPRKPGEASVFLPRPAFQVQRGQGAARRVLCGQRRRAHHDRAGFVHRRLHLGLALAHRWHEPLHAARRRCRHLGPLRLLRDGTADQRTDETGFVARVHAGQGVWRRRGDFGLHHHERGRTQHQIRAGLPATERIPVVSKDVLDIYPRKVVFFPATGKAMVKRLAHAHPETLETQERQGVATKVVQTTAGGSVDSF